MTAIRLEPTATGAVWRHGYLRFGSGNAVLLSLTPADWDALDRVLAAAESELASWVEDDRRAERRADV